MPHTTGNKSNDEIAKLESFETKGSIKLRAFEKNTGRIRFAAERGWSAMATASASGLIIGGGISKGNAPNGSEL